MNEAENPFVLIGVAALIFCVAIAWSGVSFNRERNAFEDKCLATGGQLIHPRDEILCVRDGRITAWMHT